MTSARISLSLILFLLSIVGLVAEPRRAAADDPLVGIGPVIQRATGYYFTEGPLWDPVLEGLLFSEMDDPFTACTGRIHLLTPPSTVTTFRDPSCNTNGLAFDGTDLIAMEHGSRSVKRFPASGPVETVADAYMGTPLNAPNDAIVRSDGTIYFTDPDFIGPSPPVLGFNGLFRVEAGTGTLILEDTVDGPNGVTLSPDEGTLYVADYFKHRVLSYAVQPDGNLVGPSVFAEDIMRLTDGLAVDSDGNLFVAVEQGEQGETGGIAVFSPSGSSWGMISIPEPAKNCAFGGSDYKTLYVTAISSVYSVQMVIPGVQSMPVPALPNVLWLAPGVALIASSGVILLGFRKRSPSGASD